MGQKTLRNGKINAARRLAAAAVFAGAVAVAGCGQFPQCQVYFKGEVTKQCTGFLENMKKAKEELRNVEGHREYVREKLRAKVMGGDKNPEGLNIFNEAARALGEISEKMERLRGLEMRVKRGEAVEGEVMEADERVLGVLGEINEIGRKLVSI